MLLMKDKPAWVSLQSFSISPTWKTFSCTAGKVINTDSYLQTLDDNSPVLCESRCLAESRKCNHWTDFGLWRSALGQPVRWIWEVYSILYGSGEVLARALLCVTQSGFLNFNCMKNVWFRLVCVLFKSLRECNLVEGHVYCGSPFCSEKQLKCSLTTLCILRGDCLKWIT